MENTQENLITFRPTEANRRILTINADNSGMNENELMNHFIANNSSKQRPIIDRHENTIKSQSEEIESYQEQVATLEDKNNTLQNRVSELKSKIDFLNKEKANFIPDSEELETALYDLKKANEKIEEMDGMLKTLFASGNEEGMVIRSYETELLEECFQKVEGSRLSITGDDSEEVFEILTKADLVNALVVQYSLDLEGIETDIEEED